MQGAQGPALMTLMGIEGLARPCVHCGSLSSSGSIFPVGLWLERADFTSVSGCKLAGLRSCGFTVLVPRNESHRESVESVPLWERRSRGGNSAEVKSAYKPGSYSSEVGPVYWADEPHPRCTAPTLWLR